MADGVAITAGSGTTIATDDCGAPGHAQITKLAISTDGSATLIPADATNGLDVDPTRTTPNRSVTDTSTATDDSVTLAVPGTASAAVQVTGTWVATLNFEATVNGTDWFAVNAIVPTTGAIVTTTTANGQWIVPCAGYAQIRLRANPFTSGTATIDIQASVGGQVVHQGSPLPAGNNNVGDVDVASLPSGTVAGSASLPAGTNNIGDVDVLTLPALPAGTNNIGDVDVLTLPGVAGDVAHDTADSGNPIKVGAKADSSLAGNTMVAAGDRTDLFADIDGVLLVKQMCPQTDIINERVTDTGGTSTAFTNFSAVASTRNYVTTIITYNSSATAGFLDLRDGTAGSVLMTVPLPAGGGAVINLPVPLRQPTANTALAYDVSAALTTVYISLVGYQSKA